jgi:hypothetical protein
MAPGVGIMPGIGIPAAGGMPTAGGMGMGCMAAGCGYMGGMP